MGEVQPEPVIDLSHHINAHSKARHPSPLKDIIKYMGHEGMISMAGGMIRPFEVISPLCNIASLSLYILIVPSYRPATSLTVPLPEPVDRYIPGHNGARRG